MRRFSNPNYIYVATFIIPFIVYSFEWSSLYPALTIELLGFYLLTFVIALLIGLLIDRLPGFKYHPIPVFKYNIPVLLGIYLFFVADCLYEGYIPLFRFSGGEATYDSSVKFGIPTLHVLLVTYTLFFAVYLFHQFLSSRKILLLVLYILCFVPFIFLLQRSNIMFILIGTFFLFLISQKSVSVKKALRVSALVLAAFYAFGYLGNLRSGKGDPTYIPKASGAKQEFLESSIPKEFYWAYLYIGSPVANLQNNINMYQFVDRDYQAFAIYEMVPDFISKKIADIFSATQRKFYQINSFLNVGTIYAKAYSYLSWQGMFIMFIYLMTLMNSYYLFMRRSPMYGATALSLMFATIAVANFSNSIAFSAYSFPLLYPFILSIIKGLKRPTEQKAKPVSFSFTETPSLN